MTIIGTEVKGYTLFEFIDSGQFGSVYKAQKNNKIYAIKIFRADYVLKEFREKGENNRIKREIDIMRSIKHPSLIEYIDDFQEELMGVLNYFLVMEFVPGTTLRNHIKSGNLTETKSKTIFLNILEGIKALHNIRGDEENKGIIHRDLKPENIIINDSDSTIKILDYGISKVIDYTSITTTGNMNCTPSFGQIIPEF